MTSFQVPKVALLKLRFCFFKASVRSFLITSKTCSLELNALKRIIPANSAEASKKWSKCSCFVLKSSLGVACQALRIDAIGNGNDSNH